MNGETWGQDEAEMKKYFSEEGNDPGDEPKLGLTPEKLEADESEFKAEFDKPDAEPEVDDKPDEFDAVADEALKPIAGEPVADQPATDPIEPVKPTSFKEAFAAARKSGLKVFDWNGKKYTTELKAKPVQEAVAASKVAKPKAETPLGIDKKGGVADAVSDSLTSDPTMYSTQTKKPEPKPEPKKKMSFMDVKPLAAADDAPSIYEKRKPVQAGSGMEKQIPTS